jgi:hypothetical protein
MQTNPSLDETKSAPHAPEPTGCCPPFDPVPWQDRTVAWENEPFVAGHVRTILHVPLDFGKRMTEIQGLVDAAGAAPAQPLTLCDESSPFGTELYVHVTRPVPNARMIALSGTFLTHVYEGPYRDANKWTQDMTARVAAQGKPLEKLYLAYTTCPSCAKVYGKNYVIAFAKVRNAEEQGA